MNENILKNYTEFKSGKLYSFYLKNNLLYFYKYKRKSSLREDFRANEGIILFLGIESDRIKNGLGQQMIEAKILMNGMIYYVYIPTTPYSMLSKSEEKFEYYNFKELIL